jgi:hypothetical protein
MSSRDSIDSAPDDLVEPPPSSFEEIVFAETPELGDGDESDDDESVAPEEEAPEDSVGSVDTQVVTQLEARGEKRFEDTICLVALSQKVKGKTVLCGHPRGICRRRGHQSLQGIDSFQEWFCRERSVCWWLMI